MAERSPWPVTVGVFLPWLGYLLWVHLRSLHAGVLHTGILELWVHGEQPWFDWVPYIHPPGYTVYMNGVEALAGTLRTKPGVVILVLGTVLRAGTLVFVVDAVRRRLGGRAALLAGALLAFSPNGLRPFEHYPLASAIAAVATVGCLRLLDEGTPAAARVAAGLVFASAAIHLSPWFLFGGMLAAGFALGPHRRATAQAALAAVVAFLVGTTSGFWGVLFGGTQMEELRDTTTGVVTTEWTNPALLALLLPWLVPALWRKDRATAALAAGCVGFAAVTTALQHWQVADGQPYPYGLHYYELIEAPLCLAATGLLVAVARAGWRRSAIALAGLLLLSQVGLSLLGERWLFVTPVWIATMAWPF